MDRQTLIGILEVFIKQGLPFETLLRDVKIRHEYFSEIENNPGISRTKLKQHLADKYFTGYKNIEVIVYKGGRSKVHGTGSTVETALHDM